MNRNKTLSIVIFSALVILISLGTIGGCNNNGGSGMDLDGDDDLNGGGGATTLNVSNEGVATTVYAQLPDGSCTTISDWSTNSPISCTSGSVNCTVVTPTNPTFCSFPIASDDICTLPLQSGCTSNIKLAFNPEFVTNACGDSPGTGPSVAEVNIHVPNCSKEPGCDSPPCDCVDISLVNGYTPPNISMTLSEGSTTLGPTAGATGNQSVFGVYPVGCTNCVNRDGCPCGINCNDTSQCHQGGTPDDPDIPCQASQPTGGTITVNILAN